ncbi:MAG: tetratricopeptide repeat protein [Burkholderiaceae bacterium]
MNSVHLLAAAAISAAISLVVPGAAFAANDEKLAAALQAYDAEAFDQALPVLEAASAKGHDEAQYRLGMMYRFGWGVEKDFQMAREHFMSAAKQDHPEAQSELGKIFKDGRGIDRDYKTAAMWFEKAGMQHQGVSQLNLARFYRSGRGVEKSSPHAWAWFSLAITNEYMDAIGHRARLQAKMSEEEIARAKEILADIKKDMAPR